MGLDNMNHIKLKKIIRTLLLVSIITGCSSHKPIPNSIKLSDGPTIAYAYMKDGDTLLRVQNSYSRPRDKNVEVIHIKKDGFYPDYDLGALEEDGKMLDCDLTDEKNNIRGVKNKCNSNYTTHSVGHVLLITGLLAIGHAKNLQAFDKEYFFEVIDKNNLVDEQ